MEPQMSRLLFVTSSLFGADSKSRAVAGEFVAAWQRANPGATVSERDLSPAAIPHLSLDALGAAMTPAAERAPAQQQAAALADRLIEEVEAADVIVIAAPMYNFSIPSTLKAWVDHIARAGRTFRYGAGGPEGLLKGKRVFVFTARGGVYTGESPAKAMDFQETYLRAMLGFLGLDDVTFVHAEGLNLGPDAAADGIAAAHRTAAALLPLQSAA
jgi:FMN-dependent NADH-azoreductase